VASLNAGPVMVARPGIGAVVTLLPEASMAAMVLAAALHAPVVSDEPKEEMAGGVAPEGICGGSIPVIGSALLAPTVPPGAAAAIPVVVAHVMIVPMAPPETVAGVPGMNWMAPNGFAGLAPTLGIVPGTAAGDVMGMVRDVMGVPGDVVRIVGAIGADVDPICAKVGLQPNKTVAAAVTKIRLRIDAFLRLTRQIIIAQTTALPPPATAPCCRWRV
jgi:hypothetical protein